MRHCAFSSSLSAPAKNVIPRPSRKLRCCDRTNSREFNDSPRIQRDVAILTHHRNFPANLTNHCHLPQLSPFRGYTKGGNSALQTLAEFWEWLHQTWKRNAAHVLREFRNRSGFNFNNFLRGVRGPFYIESDNTSMKCNENYLFCCE